MSVSLGNAFPTLHEEQVATFKGALLARVTELLETLVSLGQAHLVEGERFIAQ
ncbi:MAG: hypothetical protein KDI79_08660 [Anaerolineae bacterium]|nr:hypothetical protein [Anaerolineae bacterium]